MIAVEGICNRYIAEILAVVAVICAVLFYWVSYEASKRKDITGISFVMGIFTIAVYVVIF